MTPNENNLQFKRKPTNYRHEYYHFLQDHHGHHEQLTLAKQAYSHLRFNSHLRFHSHP